MAWTKDWTPEIVEQNYRALGVIDPEDIEQLLEDAKTLARQKRGLMEKINEHFEVIFGLLDHLDDVLPEHEAKLGKKSA